MAANTPPTITTVSNQTILEDSSTGALAFTIGDFETNVNNLLNNVDVTATSSDLNFTVTLGGSGASRTVTVTPNPNYNTTGDPILTPAPGPATITLTVDDGTGADAVVMFDVVVTAVNDAPNILPNPIPTQTTDEDVTLVVNFTATDVDNVITNASMVSFTDQPTLLTFNSVTTTAVSYTPVLNTFGNGNVTLSVTDGTLTTVRTFVAIVTPVNDNPTITGTGQLVVDDLEQNVLEVTIFNHYLQVVFSLGTTAGLTFTQGDGTNDLNMTFSGTKAAINAALNDLETCTDAPCAPSAGNLHIGVSDLVGGSTFTHRDTPFGPN